MNRDLCVPSLTINKEQKKKNQSKTNYCVHLENKKKKRKIKYTVMKLYPKLTKLSLGFCSHFKRWFGRKINVRAVWKEKKYFRILNGKKYRSKSHIDVKFVLLCVWEADFRIRSSYFKFSFPLCCLLCRERAPRESQRVGLQWQVLLCRKLPALNLL